MSLCLMLPHMPLLHSLHAVLGVIVAFGKYIMTLSCVAWQPVKEYVKPARQLQLSEAALTEEIVCQLTATNPTAPVNITRYIPRDRAFRQRTRPYSFKAALRPA